MASSAPTGGRRLTSWRRQLRASYFILTTAYKGSTITYYIRDEEMDIQRFQWLTHHLQAQLAQLGPWVGLRLLPIRTVCLLVSEFWQCLNVFVSAIILKNKTAWVPSNQVLLQKASQWLQVVILYLSQLRVMLWRTHFITVFSSSKGQMTSQQSGGTEALQQSH